MSHSFQPSAAPTGLDSNREWALVTPKHMISECYVNALDTEMSSTTVQEIIFSIFG